MAKKAKSGSTAAEAASLVAETREAMPVELQQLADKGMALVKKEADAVLDKYDIGALVMQATNNERRYGTAAVRQLAIVWYGNPSCEQDLQHCRFIAASYERKHLAGLLKTAGNTVRLTFNHVRQLARLSGNARLLKKRATLENAVVVDGLGVRELTREVARALGGGKQSNGGRSAAPPRSPIAGLQQLTQQLRQIQSREAIVTDYVLNPLAEVEEDAVTPELAEIMQTTYSALDEVVTLLQTYGESLASLIEKASEVLEARGEGTSDGDEALDAEASEDEEAEDDDGDELDADDADAAEDIDEVPAPKTQKAKSKPKKARKKRSRVPA